MVDVTKIWKVLVVILVSGNSKNQCCAGKDMGFGPIGLFRSNTAVDFTWQARVDRNAGLAYSYETSNVVTKSSSKKDTLLSTVVAKTDNSDLLQVAEKLFSEYPTWLCRVPTTLGLFRAVPKTKSTSASTMGSSSSSSSLVRPAYEIRSRLFNVHIFTFGSPQGRRVSFSTKNGNGKEESTECSVALPIEGGLLALNDRNKNALNRDQGALIFTLNVKRKSLTRSPNDDDDNNHQSVDSTECSIQTAIHAYQPTLCGRNLPIPKFRAACYLSTQSVVHGWVMWNFHRYCRNYQGGKDPTMLK